MYEAGAYGKGMPFTEWPGDGITSIWTTILTDLTTGAQNILNKLGRYVCTTDETSNLGIRAVPSHPERLRITMTPGENNIPFSTTAPITVILNIGIFATQGAGSFNTPGIFQINSAAGNTNVVQWSGPDYLTSGSQGRMYMSAQIEIAPQASNGGYGDIQIYLGGEGWWTEGSAATEQWTMNITVAASDSRGTASAWTGDVPVPT